MINPLRGGHGENSCEGAHELLLNYGIRALQRRAGFLPKEANEALPQTFKEFLKEKQAPRTITMISQWMTRGSTIGTMNPTIVAAISVLSRYEQIWNKSHPIPELMQYEWYRRVLEYWQIEDEDDGE